MNYNGGGAGNDDLSWSGSAGTMLAGNAGNDVLRGGKFDDILIGGAGDDAMYGGSGGDQFRFFGNQIGGQSDTDRIYDLNFAEGDKLVFGNFGDIFDDADGINAYNGGNDATITSWEGLANAYEGGNGRITFTGNAANDLLFISFENDAGQIQTLRITNGYAAFTAELTATAV